MFCSHPGIYLFFIPPPEQTHLWKSGRGNRDSPHGAGGEAELLQHRQERAEQTWAGHGVQPRHPGHVAQGVHPRVLQRPQVHECLLCAQQAHQGAWRGSHVCQGRFLIESFGGVSTGFVLLWEKLKSFGIRSIFKLEKDRTVFAVNCALISLQLRCLI